MNRRGFLQLLTAATIATAGGIQLLDFALPPERTFFLPPLGGWSLSEEFQYVVRRAFNTKLVTQLYNSSPLMSAILSRQDIIDTLPLGSPAPLLPRYSR